MGNRQLDENLEKQGDKHLARLLGISVEDYLNLDHDGIHDVISNDGLVYRHYIRFSTESPKDILNKIKGIDETNTVYFDPSSFM